MLMYLIIKKVETISVKKNIFHRRYNIKKQLIGSIIFLKHVSSAKVILQNATKFNLKKIYCSPTSFFESSVCSVGRVKVKGVERAHPVAGQCIAW